MSLANPTVAFKQQFHDTYRDALAQRESRLMPASIDRGMIDGASFTINGLGTTEMKPVTGRYQDKNPQTLDNSTRVVYMSDYDAMIVVDGFDIPKLSADPSFKYPGLLADASNRLKDKVLYRALLDPVVSKTGENAFSTVSMPSSQIVVAGGTAFTKAKAIFARSLFRKNECDNNNGEELFIAYDDNMVRQILSDNQLTSSDFIATQMLQNGEIAKNWLGFTWIPYQALDNGAGGSSERRTVAWAKSGVEVGVGINFKTDVSENKAKRGHPTEAYGWLSIGAGRNDEKKVVAIDFLTA
jgi:hypothetical protein